MKYIMATSVAAMLMAGSVQAADLIMAPEMSEPMAYSSAHDWSGFYAGVFGGYGSGNTSALPAGGTVTNISTSGWLLGVDAGVNQQWDMFVLGIEGDVAWANIGGTATVVGGGGATGTTTTNWLTTLRGRAGVAADMALFYVTAGIAAGGVSTTTSFPGSYSSTHVGWTAGAGVELAVTEDVSLKAEYAYTDLGTQNDGGALNAGVNVDIHPTFHAVKVGANFHF